MDSDASVFLIGFMGCGKSTVGKYLADQLGYHYIDTDEVIVERCHQSIPDIFNESGEGYFRDQETLALCQVPLKQHVIATGGGIIEREQNRSYLSDQVVVYLKTEWETIVSRLQGDQARPIWQDNKRDKQHLYYQREKLYQQTSQIVVTTDDKSIGAIVHEIITKFEKISIK